MSPVEKRPAPEDPEAILRRAAEAQQQKLRDLNERVTGLLNGSVHAPNEVVEYLLARIRDARKEHEQLTQQIQQLTVQLKQLTQRQAGIEGEYNSRIVDLQHWDRDLIVMRPPKDKSPEGAIAEPELKVVPEPASESAP